ncbi:MAG: TIGR04084 family radical SAM/SPASM domain-containing protein [Nitrososphaerota archaeon]|jgi:putative peptide-modifying radical SAM enzyme|nr:TIGR04084 family radical SAM/SPASM domain-containing protein [Nitrososphaerota archaeon]MDG6954642.1 TIGR04084 family radical SAM/SPASM domain-containing protein [Nitrososphaerota archaeon]
MHYHVILTKECNLLCKYCGGGSDTLPKEIQYSMDDLRSFLSQDSDPVIEFYGGEPLLRAGTMQTMMEGTSGRFVLQTNGTLLDRVEPGCLVKLDTVLVSIDGKEDVTDGQRGKGVYRRAVSNSELIRRRGFKGDLVARMTVVQGTDIRENVRHLLDLRLFDHVHWQLDFGMFWEAGIYTEPNIRGWLDEYDAGISSLVDRWVGVMERTGRVEGMVPFMGVMGTLLTGERAALRCGSGLDFFSIMPDGRISACPVSVDFDFSVVGSIFKDTPASIVNSATLGEPCASCDIVGICGGRCLFVNRSQHLLRQDGYSLICTTVRHLVGVLRGVQPRVEALVEDGKVKLSDFRYPGFNNGCEIIP